MKRKVPGEVRRRSKGRGAEGGNLWSGTVADSEYCCWADWGGGPGIPEARRRSPGVGLRGKVPR